MFYFSYLPVASVILMQNITSFILLESMMLSFLHAEIYESWSLSLALKRHQKIFFLLDLLPHLSAPQIYPEQLHIASYSYC